MLKFIRRLIGKYSTAIFTLCVTAILLAGWRLSKRQLITAERGWGYAFGIIGFILLVILLLYPFRKRFRFLGSIGEVKTWFRIHMILGIIGPVFILFHCNFQLGSFNSNVALFSMLVVSVSGIFGRYFYARIHHGLYGQRASLVELRKTLEQQKQEIDPQFSLVPGIKEKLFEFSDAVIESPKTLFQSIERNLLIRWKVFRLNLTISRMTRAYLNQHAQRHHWSNMRKRKMNSQMHRKSDEFIKQTLKVAQFGFYERLFGLWHLFHIPLVYMLFFAAVVHIIAVHLF